MIQPPLALHAKPGAGALSRALLALVGLVLLLAGLAVALFIVLPLLGIIVSAAVGGIVLALAGLLLMIPLVLVVGAVVMLLSRADSRRPRAFHVNQQQ